MSYESRKISTEDIQEAEEAAIITHKNKAEEIVGELEDLRCDMVLFVDTCLCRDGIGAECSLTSEIDYIISSLLDLFNLD